MAGYPPIFVRKGTQHHEVAYSTYYTNMQKILQRAADAAGQRQNPEQIFIVVAKRGLNNWGSAVLSGRSPKRRRLPVAA